MNVMAYMCVVQKTNYDKSQVSAEFFFFSTMNKAHTFAIKMGDSCTDIQHIFIDDQDDAPSFEVSVDEQTKLLCLG